MAGREQNTKIILLRAILTLKRDTEGVWELSWRVYMGGTLRESGS